MASLCIVCQKSKVPNYFLIKCIACSKCWHHRCHSPPIADQELIAIIRAFNDTRTRNPSAVLDWKCRTCLIPPSTRENPIVIDDDDDVEAQAATIRIIDDPVYFPTTSRPTSTTSTLASGMKRLSVSKTIKSDRGSSISTIRSPRTPTPSHPQEAELTTQENQEATSPNSSARSRSRSPTREATLVPSPSNQEFIQGPIDSNERNPDQQRSFLERWSKTIIRIPRSVHPSLVPTSQKKPLFHPALLPHHINAQYRTSASESESDKKSDAWYSAVVKKSQVKEDNPGTSRGEPTAAQVDASTASHQRRRRKKAKAVESTKVDNSFEFFASNWMKENEGALSAWQLWYKNSKRYK